MLIWSADGFLIDVPRHQAWVRTVETEHSSSVANRDRSQNRTGRGISLPSTHARIVLAISTEILETTESQASVSTTPSMSEASIGWTESVKSIRRMIRGFTDRIGSWAIRSDIINGDIHLVGTSNRFRSLWPSQVVSDLRRSGWMALWIVQLSLIWLQAVDILTSGQEHILHDRRPEQGNKAAASNLKASSCDAALHINAGPHSVFYIRCPHRTNGKDASMAIPSGCVYAELRSRNG